MSVVAYVGTCVYRLLAGDDATTALPTLSRAVVPAVQFATVIMAVAIAGAIGMFLVRSIRNGAGGGVGAQKIGNMFSTSVKKVGTLDPYNLS